MELAIVTIFLIAYAGISLEHVLKLDKSATALLSACVLWILVSATTLASGDIHTVLDVQLTPIAEIIIFLMGAMTIVQVIDSHEGFTYLTDKIVTKDKRLLLVILGVSTFLLSGVLDNLATTIVMVAIMLKFISDAKDKVIFTGIIVIAANAGGAFSPIGDITTTMLWIGGQISVQGVIREIFLPSLAAFAIPLLFGIFMLHGKLEAQKEPKVSATHVPIANWKRNLVFFTGIGSLIAVPFFKIITGLPPFMGVLGALSIMWIVTEVLSRKKFDAQTSHLTVSHALGEIDMSSVLFFVGILLSVAALEVTGTLEHLASWLSVTLSNHNLIALSLGFLSAIFDNVPLIAASMHMYPLSVLHQDNGFWLLLAFSAGTGGSMLIIGSAAGVTAMGSTKVGFGEYARRIGPLALLGYLAGVGVFYLEGGFAL